jgi:NAD(P)-dependent dehydrogenase (short-subunit alcohol dehydrogenase family)
MRFEGARVVVTGSSRNTGLGIARRFAAEGARVVVNGTDAARVAAAVSIVPGSVGAVADLSTRSGVEALFDVVDRELGGVEVFERRMFGVVVTSTLEERLSWLE